MVTFNDLDLHDDVLKAVRAQGYENPTPIQAKAIPILTEGRDLLGIAQTGTGKTAAFTLPILDYFLREPRSLKPKTMRALILAPTRELAIQIAESFKTYSAFMRCSVGTAFGGVKINPQIRMLQRGIDVVVATPGRLLDLVNQGAADLSNLDVLVLDEADQMLDLGFIHDLKRIMAKVPAERQTMLFSATMPKTIAKLAGDYLDSPQRVQIAPESTTAERVTQGVYHVEKANKPQILQSILGQGGIDRVLVFTRTKHGADAVVKSLTKANFHAKAIHGNKSQPQRVKALDAFREGTINILVATDIAARGIDIDGVSHVVNYEMPNVAEQYVHRIGRTARAGRAGVAVSLVAMDELYYLRDIERTTRQEIEVLDAPEGLEGLLSETPSRDLRVPKPKGPSGGRGRSNGQNLRSGQNQGKRSQGTGQRTGAKRPARKKRAARS